MVREYAQCQEGMRSTHLSFPLQNIARYHTRNIVIRLIGRAIDSITEEKRSLRCDCYWYGDCGGLGTVT